MTIRCSEMFVLWTVVSTVISLAGCRKSIHEAVQSSDLKGIERLIAGGADVNASDGNGDTPLHIAAIVGGYDAAKLLIVAGADIEAKDKYGYTPLHVAARNSYCAHSVARLLISKGADIHVVSPHRSLPLHLAAQGGDPYLVKLLIEKGADVNRADEYGNTPLHWAIDGKSGVEETVRILLDAGADPLARDKSGLNVIVRALLRQRDSMAKDLLRVVDLNAQDNSGDTLLHQAVRRYNPRLVKLLIENGADVNAKDAQGDTPLYVAVNYCQHEEIIKLLIKAGAQKAENRKPASEFVISRKELLEEISRLYASGGDINKNAVGGRTCLHWAVRYGYQEVIELLFTKGANANAEDDFGFKPLHLAVLQSQVDAVKMLLEHDADANAKDRIGYTAVHYAALAHNKNVELAEVLLDSGADPNIPDPLDGGTVLHIAVDRNNLSLVKVFLANGVDVNAYNKRGETPLHHAARHGFRAIAEALIREGAQVNVRDNNGHTPLDACELLIRNPRVRQEVSDLLRTHGGQSYLIEQLANPG